jgi:hypothetical protein
MYYIGLDVHKKAISSCVSPAIPICRYTLTLRLFSRNGFSSSNFRNPNPVIGGALRPFVRLIRPFKHCLGPFDFPFCQARGDFGRIWCQQLDLPVSNRRGAMINSGLTSVFRSLLTGWQITLIPREFPTLNDSLDN